ncbi:MAG: nucleotidyltransferase domain-containing protein [Candidatus Eisenbacteria bacterium]
MHKLLYQGSEEEEEGIRANLTKAVEAVLRELGQERLEAVVLAGSFGRGEGAVVREADSPPRPFNDIDILIVGSRPRVPCDSLARLRETLRALAGADFADVGYMNSSDFARALPTVFLYELKHGSTVLWGSADFYRKLPPLDGKDLPLSEGTRLFLNRGIGLLSLLLMLEAGGDQNSLLRCAAAAWSKVVLAAGDSLLLQRNAYHWSYAERVERVRETMRVRDCEDGLLEKYERAALLKLTGNLSLLPAGDAEALSDDARALHEVSFRRFESSRTFAPLGDWCEYPVTLLRAGLAPLERRLKEFLCDRARPGRLSASDFLRFARLPLWGEERRLALLPLLLYSPQEAESLRLSSRYLEAASWLEHGNRKVRAGTWNRLAREVVGDSHP